MKRIIGATASLAVAAAAVLLACVGSDPEIDAPLSGADTGTGTDASASDGDSATTTDGGPCNANAPFGEPVKVQGLVSGALSEQHLTMNEAETEAYFSQYTPGQEVTTSDIVGTNRASRGVAFEQPSTMRTAALSRAGALDADPTLSADRLSLVYVERENDGGAHSFMIARRAMPSEAFGTPAPVAFEPALEPYRFPRDPFVTAEGIHFVGRPAEQAVVFRLFFAPTDGDAGFGSATAQDLPDVTGTTSIRAPVVSADGTTLYFARITPPPDGGGATTTRIWSAKKNGSAWGTPEEVPNVNLGNTQSPAWVSRDGCRLYLSREETGQLDFYVATRP